MSLSRGGGGATLWKTSPSRGRGGPLIRGYRVYLTSMIVLHLITFVITAKSARS